MQACKIHTDPPPPRRSGRSECLVCAAPCPDKLTAAQRGSVSDSAPSDTCGWWGEGSSPTLPAGQQDTTI